MTVKKSNKKKISALFARSRILAFFVAIASFFHDKAEYSLTGRLFTSYNENALEESLLSRLFGRLQPGKRFVRPLKRAVSRLTSQSLFIATFKNYLRGWLYTKLNVYGLLLITAGFAFLLVQLLKIYILKIALLSFLDLFTSGLMVLLAVIMMFSGATLNTAICKSKMAKTVLFDRFGCKREVFEVADAVGGHNRTALPLGLALGIISWWVRPSEILIGLVVVVFAFIVIHIPENGVVAIAFLLPFISLGKIKALVVYTAICFVLKYARGKRTVKFDPLAWTVLLFALLSLGLGNAKAGGPIAFVLFFLAVNLIKSRQWLRRCTGALTTSFLIAVLYGLAKYVSAAVGFGYFDHLFKCEFNSEMVAFFESPTVFAGYILMVIPFSAVMINRKSQRLGALIAISAGAVCLWLTGEYLALPGVVAGVILFLVIFSRKTMAALGIMLCIFPFVYLNMHRFISEITAYRDVIDYLAHVVRGGFLADKNFYDWFVIISIAFILFLCLQKNITLYSKGCSADGRLTSLAALSGMVSLPVMLMAGASMADEKLALAFWLLAALCSCVSGTERDESCGCGPDSYEYI